MPVIIVSHWKLVQLPLVRQKWTITLSNNSVWKEGVCTFSNHRTPHESVFPWTPWRKEKWFNRRERIHPDVFTSSDSPGKYWVEVQRKLGHSKHEKQWGSKSAELLASATGLQCRETSSAKKKNDAGDVFYWGYMMTMSLFLQNQRINKKKDWSQHKANFNGAKYSKVSKKLQFVA